MPAASFPRLRAVLRGVRFQTGLRPGINFAGEVQHAREAGERFLALVVVIAEPDAKLVGDGPFLHAADEQIDFLFQKEIGQFQRVGVVDDDRPGIAELAELFVVSVSPVCDPTITVCMPSSRKARTSENALNAPPT